MTSRTGKISVTTRASSKPTTIAGDVAAAARTPVRAGRSRAVYMSRAARGHADFGPVALQCCAV
ncbi:hypothetical protein ILP97_02610 [Amycolatopsis sp. H6(2020)]|nr:hypothetical protein [Amycolatopsis sp. H6(2020)]